MIYVTTIRSINKAYLGDEIESKIKDLKYQYSCDNFDILDIKIYDNRSFASAIIIYKFDS